MKWITFFLLTLFGGINLLSGQVLKGVVQDATNMQPLVGVTIILSDLEDNFIKGTISGIDGQFLLDIGNQKTDYKLTFSYLGAQPQFFTNYDLVSAFGQELTVLMTFDNNLLDCELIIKAPPYHFFSSNKIDQVSISGNHPGFAASFNDPSRSLIRLPGVSVSSDQSNAIVFRGLPNEFISWRMDGAEIVNPNHLSSAGTLSDRSAANSGGVMTIPFETLESYDFHASNYSLAFENAIAGISDLIPARNLYQKPSFLKFGFLGAEAGFSKIFEKKKKFALHQINAQYRYSFTGLLADLGVDLGDEEIRYSDFFLNAKIYESESSNLYLRTSYGKSSNDEGFPKTQDSETFILGLAYDLVDDFGNEKLKLSLYHSDINQSNFLQDLISQSTNPYEGRSDQLFNGDSKTALHSRMRLINKPGKRLFIGNNFSLNNSSSSWFVRLRNENNNRIKFISGNGPKINGNVFLGLENHYNKLKFEPQISWTFNSVETFIPEGRINMTYDQSEHQVSFSLAKHSQLPQAAFFSLGHEATSDVSELQFSDLKTIKSIGTNLSYSYKPYQGQTGEHIRLNLFYQYLYDLPISLDGNFDPFTGLDFIEPTEMQSIGKARTYGIDLMYHRALFSDLHINLNTSLFDAKYNRLSGGVLSDIEFDSPFNYGYTFNALLTHRAKLKTKKFYTSLAYHLHGGAFLPRVDLTKSEAMNRSIYTTDFIQQESAYQRLDLRMRYEFGKNQLILDIQNLLNTENIGFEFYNRNENEIQEKNQLGMIPILSYKRLF